MSHTETVLDTIRAKLEEINDVHEEFRPLVQVLEDAENRQTLEPPAIELWVIDESDSEGEELGYWRVDLEIGIDVTLLPIAQVGLEKRIARARHSVRRALAAVDWEALGVFREGSSSASFHQEDERESEDNGFGLTVSLYYELDEETLEPVL